jgi:cytochrome c-type biogenesis protein CcmH
MTVMSRKLKVQSTPLCYEDVPSGSFRHPSTTLRYTQDECFSAQRSTPNSLHPTRFLSLIALFLFIILNVLASPRFAIGQAPDFDENVRKVAKQLNCPTCAGRNLADCPTETCLQWKTEIKTQLDAGKNAEQVIAYFQQRFGETVMQEPPRQGATLWLWLAPTLAALALLAGGVIAARRFSRSAVSTVESAISTNDAYAAELERQVNENR